MIYELGNDLHIRPFTEEDMTQEYFDAFHDPEVTRYNSHGLFPHTPHKAREFLQTVQQGSGAVWAIILKREVKVAIPPIYASPKSRPLVPKIINTAIGNICLQSLNLIHRSAELALVVWDKESWGKGYSTRVVKAVLEHAFDKLGLNRVWTGTAETNMGMRRVAEKCGFTHEGTLREGVWQNGEFVDVYAYGLTREQWIWIRDHLNEEAV